MMYDALKAYALSKFLQGSSIIRGKANANLKNYLQKFNETIKINKIMEIFFCSEG